VTRVRFLCMVAGPLGLDGSPPPPPGASAYCQVAIDSSFLMKQRAPPPVTGVGLRREWECASISDCYGCAASRSRHCAGGRATGHSKDRSNPSPRGKSKSRVPGGANETATEIATR